MIPKTDVMAFVDDDDETIGRIFIEDETIGFEGNTSESADMLFELLVEKLVEEYPWLKKSA